MVIFKPGKKGANRHAIKTPLYFRLKSKYTGLLNRTTKSVKKNISDTMWTGFFEKITFISKKSKNQKLLLIKNSKLLQYVPYKYNRLRLLFQSTVFNEQPVFKLIYWQFRTGMRFNRLYTLLNNALVYSASPGNYVTLITIDLDKGILFFKYPSKKVLITNKYITCSLNIDCSKLTRYRRYGSFKNKCFLKKKLINVRGIAMNPVDHPNGGRSNIKKPFLNKYNHVAKNNK